MHMMGASPFLYRIPPYETADTVISSAGCAGSGAAGGVVEVGSAAGGVVEVGSATGGSVTGGTVEAGSVAGGSVTGGIVEVGSVAGGSVTGGTIEVGSGAGGVVEVGSGAGASAEEGSAGGKVSSGTAEEGSGDSSVSEVFSVSYIVASVSSVEVLSGGVSVSVSAMLLVSRADSQADCDSAAAEKDMVRLVSDSGSFVCDGIALDVSVSVMLRSAEHPHNIPAAKMSISSLLIFMCLIILQI